MGVRGVKMADKQTRKEHASPRRRRNVGGAASEHSLRAEGDESDHEEEEDAHEPELHHDEHGPPEQLPLDLCGRDMSRARAELPASSTHAGRQDKRSKEGKSNREKGWREERERERERER